MTAPPAVMVVAIPQAQLNRKAKLLTWATIGYNTLEGIIAIAAGIVAGSVALTSFGLDSVVEVTSAAALAWQFAHRTDPCAREQRTLRLIAWAFFALAGYVALDSLRSLVSGREAEHSPVGIALTATSVIVMPVLVYAKRRVGHKLGSTTLLADSKQTLLCTYLSAVVLAGLIVNALVGWWWFDPTIGLLIAAFAVKEGRQAWRGKTCCA